MTYSTYSRSAGGYIYMVLSFCLLGAGFGEDDETDENPPFLVKLLIYSVYAYIFVFASLRILMHHVLSAEKHDLEKWDKACKYVDVGYLVFVLCGALWLRRMQIVN